MGHNCIGRNYTGSSKLETEVATLHEELEAAKTALARARVYFGQRFRGMPTASAEGWIEPAGSMAKVRRVFRYLQIDAGPRRSPSACAEMLKKNTLE